MGFVVWILHSDSSKTPSNNITHCYKNYSINSFFFLIHSIFSNASIKFVEFIVVLFCRIAKIAASFAIFSISAPEKPLVNVAISSRSVFSSNNLLRKCTSIILRRPDTSGNPTTTFLSF